MKAFKYRGRWRLAAPLASMARRRLSDRGLFQELFDVDVLVPVPTTTSNFLKRGFHHTGLLAEELKKRSGLPVERYALQARQTAVAQASLRTWEERRENVRSTFFTHSRQVRGKRVLLLDDVITTGATLLEAAETLREAGAELVNGLSLCRAPAFLRYRLAAMEEQEKELGIT